MVAISLLDQSAFFVDVSGTTLEVHRDMRSHARAVATPPAEPSGRTAEVVLTLPANAIVDGATATVTSRAPGRTPLSGIAQVRSSGDDPAAASTTLVIDLGGFATVSGLDLPGDISGVSTWAGAAFAPLVGVSVSSGIAVFAGEVMTTKLLVSFRSAVDPVEVQSDGFATLPAVPTGLSLTVDGAQVWRGDPALILAKGSAEAGATVDVTPVLRAAVGSQDRQVAVGLLADQPGVISISVDAPLLLTHDVDLGVPPATFVAAEEGDLTVTLPLPTGSAAWRVHHVVATVDVDPPAERVLPEVGPPPSSAYHLVLAPGRALLVRLAPAPLRRLGTISAVRVPLLAGADGAEVAGLLLAADPQGRPGTPVPGGTLAPVALGPGQPGAAPAWTTLATAKAIDAPQPVPPATTPPALWLSLQVARGQVGTVVAAPGTSGADDALVYRLDPTGVAVPLSRVTLAPPPLGSVRVVGLPPDEAPVPPARVLLPGGAGADVQPGAATTVSPESPVRPDQPGALTMTLRVAAPATYAVQSVRLVYEEADA